MLNLPSRLRRLVFRTPSSPFQPTIAAAIRVTSRDLDNFVAKVDSEGGPDSPYISSITPTFQYVPTVRIDQDQDPDGESYMRSMMALYEELANRKFEPEHTEMTSLDVENLIPRESPYAGTPVRSRALHYQRLSTALRQSGAGDGRALDMGCGWGLSSEFLAQLGYSVTAIDINPLFVNLVERRARRLGLDISVHQGTFDAFQVDAQSYDAALFYECFHHASRPRETLAKIAAALKPGGKLLLVGEPIQSLWWKHWGLRLDPLSIYCIRKFGWFESGWSSEYLSRIVSDAGLVPEMHVHPDPAVGQILIGHKTNRLERELLHSAAVPGDWWIEGAFLVSNQAGRTSRLRLPGRSHSHVTLRLHNHSAAPLDVEAKAAGAVSKHRLVQGANEIRIPFGTEPQAELELSCNGWCPNDVLSNGDQRILGFHLEAVDLS